MDITIETAVVALVALVAAVAVLGIATGQVGDFTNFADKQTSGANCQLLQTQYENCQIDEEKLNDNDCDVPSRDCSTEGSTEG